VKNVLQRLLAGELNVDEAEAELRRVQLEELGGRARLDLGRQGRRGLPEVVLAAGKAPADVARLAVALAGGQGQACLSRLDAAHRAEVETAAGQAGLAVIPYGASAARVVRPGFEPAAGGGRVAVITAGTSDLDAAAIVAVTNGDGKAAVADGLQAIASDPVAVDPHFELSAIYSSLGNEQAARKTERGDAAPLWGLR